MVELREILKRERLEEKSIAAIEINTYLRLWDKEVFVARERDGAPSAFFLPVKASEFLTQQMYCAAGLLEIGVEKGDFVAVFSHNSVRFCAAVFAILSIGAVFTPIYPTVTENEAEELLRFAESRVVFAGDISQYQKTRSILNKVKSPLRRVIAMYNVESSDKGVITFNELVRLGKMSGKVEEVIKILKGMESSDIAALLFTPGTTGMPKGALLTHGNFIAQRCIIERFKITEKDVRVAHLPMTHVFGLSADLFSSAATGSLLGIARSFETEEVIEFINELRPTFICTVPRMYEKICVTVLQGINQLGAISRSVHTLAIRVGKHCYTRSCKGKKPSLLAEILRKIMAPLYIQMRRSIGMNRVRILVSGGGPLPLEVAYFFGGIGLPIHEGYGLTETAPIINVNPIEKNKPGTVGPAVSGVQERISEDGEILVGGATVFKGYYRNPEEDEIAFTADGYFRTGDLGQFDEDGYLTITGRIKDLIITSAGKNIAPLHIERMFENDPMIDNLCVLGDRRKYLTALVVPNFDRLCMLARERNIKFERAEELVEHPEIIEFYKRRLDEVCSGMAKYEQIKKFTLLPYEFSVHSGELSPTFKFRRFHVQEKYKDIIDKMYPSSDSLADDI